MLIVKKFGGTSVADKDKIFNVARRCMEDYEKGNEIVVVLSAMGKQTDYLLGQAKDINPKASKREIDMLLTTGEQISVALVAMALESLGVPAISLNAFQIPMHTTSVYGNARLKTIDTKRIKDELQNNRIVLVTGFQGINKNGDYTTLGRGGSDTTAVALAAALNADSCEIYTDVDGVYSADPNIVSNARKLEEVTYDEMLELASLGAGVLHNRSVELAKKFRIKLVVRSSMKRAEGTEVTDELKLEKLMVSGVAADKNTARIAVIGLEDQPGAAYRVFQYLADHDINVDIMIQSIGRNNTQDISFTVKENDLEETVELLEKFRNTGIPFESIDYEREVAKVSIVGTGMMSNAGLASKMFEALFEAGINIKMISTSEIRVTVLIDEPETERAVKAVHDKFFERQI